MDGPGWAGNLIRFGILAGLDIRLGWEIWLGWFGYLVCLEICWVGDLAGLDIGLSLTFGWVGDFVREILLG